MLKFVLLCVCDDDPRSDSQSGGVGKMLWDIPAPLGALQCQLHISTLVLKRGLNPGFQRSGA